MSAAVEAAAKALFEQRQGESAKWDDFHPVIQEAYQDIASTVLDAALPHLTEGLADVLDEKLNDFANDRDADGSMFVDYLAAAITEDLKRRIEA